MLAPGRPAAYGPSTVAHLPLDGKTSEETLAKARALVGPFCALTGHGRPLLSYPEPYNLNPNPCRAMGGRNHASVSIGCRFAHFFIETDAEARLGVAGHARPKPELKKSPTRLALAAPTC